MSQWKHLFLLLMVHGLLFPAAADESQSFELTGETQLKVNGLRGRVVLRGIPSEQELSGEEKLRVRVKRRQKGSDPESPWQISISQKGAMIHVETLGPEREGWLSLSEKVPAFDVFVSGPAVPTQVFLQEGRVEESNWNRRTQVTMRQGEFVSSDSEANKQLAMGRESKITVLRLKGDLAADLYSGVIQLTSIEGAVKIENFSGESKVSEHQGAVDVVSYDGSVELSQVKGDVEFDIQRGKLTVSSYEGKMRGEARDSSVNIGYLDPSNIRLKTQSGTVRLRSPKNSATRVNVGTKEGTLYLPNHFKVTRTPSMKISTGRLRGENASWVHVRSEQGDVVVR